MATTMEKLKEQIKRLEADLETERVTNKELSDDNDRLREEIQQLRESTASEVNVSLNF